MLVTATSSLPHYYGLYSQAIVTPSDTPLIKTIDPLSGDETANGKQLTADQQRQVQELKSRDQEVRNHEQAHLSTAGGLAVSGVQFKYTIGPDGQRYASGGEVSIDTSEVPGDPQATLLKAETIRRAALAPANPSGQDQSIAAKASAMANKARAELLMLRQDTNRNGHLLDIKA